MKSLTIFLYAVVVWFVVTSCTKDNGNYNYDTLNSIEIQGIDEVYQVDQFDTLKINTLELKFSQGKILEELAFEWKLNGKVISTERECKAEITLPAVESTYQALLCITNKQNNLKYYQKFKVKVRTIYTNGLYILSEDKYGSAFLTFQSRDRANASLMHNVFERNNPEFGSLGKKPHQLVYNEMSGLHVICEEGDKKLSTLDLMTMELKGYYTEVSVGEGYTGSFAPSFYSYTESGGMVGSEGKLFMFNFRGSETLYYPVEGDYDFVWADANPGYAEYLWFAYDAKNEQFVVMEKLTDNAVLFDQITPFESVITTGQRYLTSGTIATGPFTSDLYPVLYNPSNHTAYFYEIRYEGNYDWNTGKWIFDIACKNILHKVSLLDENSVCILNNAGYWFIANGSKIERLFSKGGETVEWFSGLTGKVTAMMFDQREERIFVATYDGVSSYIYELNALTIGEQLAEPLMMEGKVVSMCAIGEWTY